MSAQRAERATGLPGRDLPAALIACAGLFALTVPCLTMLVPAGIAAAFAAFAGLALFGLRVAARPGQPNSKQVTMGAAWVPATIVQTGATS